MGGQILKDGNAIRKLTNPVTGGTMRRGLKSLLKGSPSAGRSYATLLLTNSVQTKLRLDTKQALRAACLVAILGDGARVASEITNDEVDAAFG